MTVEVKSARVGGLYFSATVEDRYKRVSATRQGALQLRANRRHTKYVASHPTPSRREYWEEQATFIHTLRDTL